MIACPSFQKSLLPAMCAILLSGCVLDSYPEDLRYPPRTDPLVTATVAYSPTQFDPPGQMGYLLSKLDNPTDKALIIDLSHFKKEDQRTRMTSLRPKLYSLLEKNFGTPLNPKVPTLAKQDKDGSPIPDSDLTKDLKLEKEKLVEGSRLYRLHCLHCHGLAGNGRGPTAPWVNPHPRDFRSGIFKFTSTSQAFQVRKARRDDLLRTLREGVEGTAMPSFGLQPEKDLEALASYVIHLSLRGQVEFESLRGILSEAEPWDPSEFDEKFKEQVDTLANLWYQAQAKEGLIDPPADQYPTDLEASVQRGFQAFRGDAGCISCHIDFGRQPNLKPDGWGTIVRPADLTQGVYRGGRRPIDLYWRIHSGINGANMAGSNQQPRTIWDIVNFLQVLPYPEMRKQYGIEINQ